MIERIRIFINVRKSIYDIMISEITATETPKNTFTQHAIIEKLMFSEIFQTEFLRICELQGKDFNYYDMKKSFEKINSIKNEYHELAQKIIKMTYRILK